MLLEFDVDFVAVVIMLMFINRRREILCHILRDFRLSFIFLLTLVCIRSS